MIGSWLTLGTSFSDNSLQWRLPLALQLVPCAAMVFFLQWTPESPRWLLLHDRTEEGHEALRRYLGKGLTLDDETVMKELMSIRGAIEIERLSQISFKEVILGRDRSGHLRRLLLGCGTQFMQQFGGINALNYYVSQLNYLVSPCSSNMLSVPDHPRTKPWHVQLHVPCPYWLQCYFLRHFIGSRLLDD